MYVILSVVGWIWTAVFFAGFAIVRLRRKPETAAAPVTQKVEPNESR